MIHPSIFDTINLVATTILAFLVLFLIKKFGEDNRKFVKELKEAYY